MARDFDGVDDIIGNAAIVGAAGSWSWIGWVRPDNAGEGNAGVFFAGATAAEGSIHLLRFLAAGRTLRATQVHATTNATTDTTTALTAGAWQTVCATYNAADKTCRVYTGAPMIEAGYAVQTAGTGAQTGGVVRYRLGNVAAGTNTFDGRIARAAYWARLLTVDEMEGFRLGQSPVQDGTLIAYHPLSTQAQDLSGNGYHGTITGAVAAEDPPVPAAPLVGAVLL